ncbi:hypothetical protein [Plantibacter sp. YIM 135249]|uniref:hypothetical protein n=1 Tax=Plantibacter sp. YIM 135249 TaxID=3423918 RepID=UPI003D343A8D
MTDDVQLPPGWGVGQTALTAVWFLLLLWAIVTVMLRWRHAPQGLWLALVLLIPMVGPLVWLVHFYTSPPGPTTPADDTNTDQHLRRER